MAAGAPYVVGDILQGDPRGANSIAERKERPQEHRPEFGSGRCGETAFEEARNQQFAIDRAQAWLCP